MTVRQLTIRAQLPCGITAIVFGFVGYAVKRYRWSRATFACASGARQLTLDSSGRRPL